MKRIKGVCKDGCAGTSTQPAQKGAGWKSGKGGYFFGDNKKRNMWVAGGTQRSAQIGL